MVMQQPQNMTPADDNRREVIRVEEAQAGPSSLGGTYTVIFQHGADRSAPQAGHRQEEVEN